MSDQLISEVIPSVWALDLSVAPTEDGKWVKTTISYRRPGDKRPTYINNTSTSDLIYERLQGEINNVLRLLVNDIVVKVVKPNLPMHRRR